MSSPTSRSLKLLRDAGYTVAITERWNPYARLRQDMFGFVDLLALKDDETVAVQTTTSANMAARIEKIKLLPAADFWLQSPTRIILVHGWSKGGKRGERKTWRCRTVEIKNVNGCLTALEVV